MEPKSTNEEAIAYFNELLVSLYCQTSELRMAGVITEKTMVEMDALVIKLQKLLVDGVDS